MKKQLSLIQLRQLEEKLEKFRQLAAAESPKDGWIHTIRSALGLTTNQLAERMGVTRQAVLQLEAAERNQTASWTSLRKAADAMECDVVVALVPRGSINQVLLRQGRRQAEKHVERIAHSMKLDAHVVGPAEQAQQVEELAQQLAAERSRALWATDPKPAPRSAPPPRYHGRAQRVV
ncbi:MAG TPA: mobile mystery protein A [Gemmatimonadaceae bacterium]|nr:mobile mystery protein A [Gemmatimonadaceae bacterium]